MATINLNLRKFSLENRLFVALEDTQTLTVAGRLRIWHGALDEKPEERGFAHILEHIMMAGGSRKYTPRESDIMKGYFSSFNAYTYLEKTVFPFDILSEDAELFLDYLSDQVFHPRFEENPFEQQKKRVLMEIAEEKSNCRFNDEKMYTEAFFGKDSPQSYFILGEEPAVESATVDKVSSFHRRGYSPPNMDLILVGKLPKNIESLIEKKFGGINGNVRKKTDIPRNPELMGSTIIHTRAPELFNRDNPSQSMAQLGMSLYAPTDREKDSFDVSMLVNILGGNANSRLFRSLSNRKGLTYGLSIKYDRNYYKGAIYIGSKVLAKRGDEAIDAIFEEMQRLRTEPLSQEALERNKRGFHYSIAKSLEDNYRRVGLIELKIDKGIDPQDYLARIDSVTPQSIMDAAVKYLPKSREEGKYVLILRDPLKE